MNSYKYFLIDSEICVLPIGRNRCVRGRPSLVNGRMAVAERILKAQFKEKCLVLHQDQFNYHDSIKQINTLDVAKIEEALEST